MCPSTPENTAILPSAVTETVFKPTSHLLFIRPLSAPVQSRSNIAALASSPTFASPVASAFYGNSCLDATIVCQSGWGLALGRLVRVLACLVH
ncbi:unnamed protein product [Protopolystoma xenopodis]|uniref:Uncharacterized protein n=1 Tax=Protopolystoma xenopodis TaxID=117903 RepID=A0A3S5CI97_9PLAT|nr:unnamed protein product [Protopolystoma xenopodis]